MRVARGCGALVLLIAVGWAAWWIAWYAGTQSSGSAIPPPPGLSLIQR